MANPTLMYVKDGTFIVALTEAELDTPADMGCQVTSGTLESELTNADVKGTFCSPAYSVTTGSSYTANLDIYQDWTDPAGLCWFLHDNEGTEVWFEFAWAGPNGPKVRGQFTAASPTIGGAEGEPLEASMAFPVAGKPEFIKPTGLVAATGATAGTPGTWTPSGATPPVDVAALQASSIVASPATAWATGEYVQTLAAGTPGQAHWSGTAWTSGVAALEADEAAAETDEAAAETASV